MKYNFIFINGWNGSPSLFMPLIESLKSVSNKTIVLDWYDNEVLSAQKLNETIELLNDSSKTVLIGWSSGSIPILSYLASESIHPSLAHSILIGATSRFVMDQSRDYGFAWHAEVVKQMADNLLNLPDNVIHSFSKKMLSGSDKINKTLTEAFMALGLEALNNEKRMNSLYHELYTLSQVDVRHELPKIVHPLHLISGEDDKICSPLHSRWIQHHTSKSQFISIEDTGHAPHYFKTQVCSDIIIEILKENSSYE